MYPHPSLNQPLLTYLRRQKNITSTSQTQSSMIRKNHKILMWNVRRSTSSNFFIFLLDLLREHQPIILIFIQVPQPDHTVCLIQDNYGFPHLEQVEPMYHCGGIWYFWKYHVQTIDFISTELSLFHSLRTLDPEEPKVLLTTMHPVLHLNYRSFGISLHRTPHLQSSLDPNGRP